MLKLLLTDTRPAGSYPFCSADNATLFEKNLKEQSESWFWRSRSVTYTINSQGYRCGEFDDLDWSNSVLTFGCSNTYGIGVDDLDTWPHKLMEFIKRPVINLAQGGMGWGFNWINSVRIIEAGYRPLAAIYYWPTAERMFTFPNPKNPLLVTGHGPWNSNKDKNLPEVQLGLLWAQDPYLPHFWAEQYRQSLDIMWGRIGVPVRHYTWDMNNKVPEVEHMQISSAGQNNVNLRARDLMHPGPEDNAIMALRVSMRLSL